MKRKATPEQQAQAQQRREAFKGLVKQVGAMSPEERSALSAKMNAVVTVAGHYLSLTNTMLVSMQHPGVTLVGGFGQWREAGRMVRKGEHGMMIWIPSAKGKNSDEPAADDDLHFFTGTVFDISQTEEVATV